MVPAACPSQTPSGEHVSCGAHLAGQQGGSGLHGRRAGEQLVGDLQEGPARLPGRQEGADQGGCLRRPFLLRVWGFRGSAWAARHSVQVCISAWDQGTLHRPGVRLCGCSAAAAGMCMQGWRRGVSALLENRLTTAQMMVRMHQNVKYCTHTRLRRPVDRCARQQASALRHASLCENTRAAQSARRPAASLAKQGAGPGQGLCMAAQSILGAHPLAEDGRGQRQAGPQDDEHDGEAPAQDHDDLLGPLHGLRAVRA